MAHGVLPPKSGVVLAEALFRSLVELPDAYVRPEEARHCPDAVSFCKERKGSQNRGDLQLLGNAANRVIVPAEVVDDYLSVLQLAQTFSIQAGWPDFWRATGCSDLWQRPHYLPGLEETVSDSSKFELTQILTLFCAALFQLKGSGKSLQLLKASLQDDPLIENEWRAVIVGQLHPNMWRFEEALGSMLFEDIARFSQRRYSSVFEDMVSRLEDNPFPVIERCVSELG